jgi:hypothetical protein
MVPGTAAEAEGVGDNDVVGVTEGVPLFEGVPLEEGLTATTRGSLQSVVGRGGSETSLSKLVDRTATPPTENSHEPVPEEKPANRVTSLGNSGLRARQTAEPARPGLMSVVLGGRAREAPIQASVGSRASSCALPVHAVALPFTATAHVVDVYVERPPLATPHLQMKLLACQYSAGVGVSVDKVIWSTTKPVHDGT